MSILSNSILSSFLTNWLKGGPHMLESKFKSNLINELETRFPGCIVAHLDGSETQGIPDLIVLYKNKWAALEGKKTATSAVRPNQPYYVDLMNRMSFASFIYPENKDEVLDRLSKHFLNRRRI